MLHTFTIRFLMLAGLLAGTTANAQGGDIPPQPFRYVTYGFLWGAGPATPDGEHIFLSASDGVHLLNLDTRRIDKSFRSESMVDDLRSNYTYDAQREILYAHGVYSSFQWDWETGEAIALPKEHEFSKPDFVLDNGTWVFSSKSYDDTPVTLVDPATGNIIQTLFEGESYAYIRFSRDGSKVALSRGNREPHRIEIYDLATETLLRTIEVALPAPNYSMKSLIISPDGWTVAANFQTTSSPIVDRTFAWNTGSEVMLMDGSPALRQFLDWSTYGLVAQKRDGELTIVDNDTLEVAHEVELGMEEIYTTTFSPDGGTIYCTGIGDFGAVLGENYPFRFILQIVDVASGEITHTLKSLSGSVSDFALDATDTKLTMIDFNVALSTWSTAGDPLAEWNYELYNTPRESAQIAMTQDGATVACWSEDRSQLVLWSNDGEQLGLLHQENGYRVQYPSFSPDGRWLLARDDGRTTVWDVAIQEVASSLPEYAAVFTGRNPKEVLRITANQILVGPFDGEGTVSVPVSFPDANEIWKLGMSRNGEYFWGIPWVPGAVLVGEVDTGNFTWIPIPEVTTYLEAVAVSDDGTRVTLEGNGNGVSISGIFDVATGQQLREIPLGNTAYFSADGDWLYSDNSGIKQWAATVNGCKIQCGDAEGDADADGLTDCVEACYQSDPQNADTDGDYMPDGYEAEEGHEPLLADAGPDGDGDGLGVFAEEFFGTNPELGDTDGDGAMDLNEILAGTDPLVDENAVEGEGGAEGLVEGEGIVEGEGGVEGATDGEGVQEGEGSTDGEGVVEGSIEGSEEGIVEGIVEGIAEGEGEPLLPAGPVLQGFRSADANGDQRLSVVEFSGISGGTQAAFDALDLNDDGALSIAELQRQVVGASPLHNADVNGDARIGLAELLRVVQLRNAGGYDCAANPDVSEDGFVLDADGALSTGCPAHASDYLETDGVISLSELLRLIQLYNSGAIAPCESSEDGFCAAV